MSVDCGDRQLEICLDLVLSHPKIEEFEIYPREDLIYFGISILLRFFKLFLESLCTYGYL